MEKPIPSFKILWRAMLDAIKALMKLRRVMVAYGYSGRAMIIDRILSQLRETKRLMKLEHDQAEP